MQHDESNEIGVFTSKEELTRWKLLMEALRGSSMSFAFDGAPGIGDQLYTTTLREG